MKNKDKKFYQMFSVRKHIIDNYDEWNKKRYENRTHPENIFPEGMTDAEFRKFIIDIFLGDDWYITYSGSQTQINEEALEEILYKFTGKEAYERDKVREKEQAKKNKK